MGEVDQLEDAVDERVPEGDERVDRASRETRERELEEGAPVLEQVDDEPDDEDADEGEPDRRGDDLRDRSWPRLLWTVSACAWVDITAS